MTAQPPGAGEIRLPCGVTLEFLREDVWGTRGEWRCDLVRDPFVDSPNRDRWIAHVGDEREDICGTRAECIAWLDASVLAIRRALAPEGARQRVALALLPKGDTLCTDPECVGCVRTFKYADKVLAALGMEDA